MSRSIEFRDSARRDLAGIWSYTRDRWGMAQAETYLDALEAATKRLSENPTVGSTRSDLFPGLHKLSAGSHAVFYLFDDAVLDVVRILHVRQDAISALGGR